MALDITSPFTNIPKELVVAAIHRTWFKIKKFTTLPKNEFFAGIGFFFDESCFQFNGEFYKQIFGYPMGSAASLVSADLILEILEDLKIRYFEVCGQGMPYCAAVNREEFRAFRS